MQVIQDGLAAAVKAHLRGDLLNATKICAAILELEPVHPAALHHLGVLCHQLGKHEDACRLVERAIDALLRQLSPTDHDGLVALREFRLNLSAAVLANGDPTAALHQCELVWQGDLIGIGRGHHGGDHRSDTQVLSDSTTSSWRNETCYLRRSQVLCQLNRFDDALECLQDGTARYPAHGPLMVAYANLLHERGELSAAESAYARAVELDANSASCLFNYCRLLLDRGREVPTPLIARLESHAASAKPSERTLGLFPLAAIAGQQHDIAAAFSRYAEGNRSRRAALRASGHILPKAEDLRVLTDSIQEACSSQSLERWRRWGSNSRQPLFIVGAPRSGTTLVEQVLVSHAQVASVGERNNIELLLNERLRQRGIPDDMPLGLSEFTAEDWQACGRAYLEQLSESIEQATYVINKLPGNLFWAGVIHAMFPNCRMICCQRDARDVVWSCFTQNFRADSLAAICSDLAVAQAYVLQCQQLADFWQQQLPTENWRTIHYERFVQTPTDEIARLLEFLELPWDDNCLRFYEQQRVVRTASLNQVRETFHQRAIGRWRPFAAELDACLNGFSQMNASDD